MGSGKTKCIQHFSCEENKSKWKNKCSNKRENLMDRIQPGDYFSPSIQVTLRKKGERKYSKKREGEKRKKQTKKNFSYEEFEPCIWHIIYFCWNMSEEDLERIKYQTNVSLISTKGIK